MAKRPSPASKSSDFVERDVSLEDLALDDHPTDGKPHSKGGYRFELPEEQQAMKDQRSELWKWLRGIGTHLLRDGFNLTTISMPVTLFEPRSWLERICDNWGYLYLLEMAADEANPVMRLKLVVAFAVAGLRQQVSFGKPFNPILGETFHGQFPNGGEVFVEQISHHPPISSWQLYGHGGRYLYYGNGTWSASAHGNSLKGQQAGLNCVRFARDGASVTWELPTMSIKGILFGDRVLKYDGHMTFRDEHNGLVCDVDIDADAEGFFRSLLHLRRKKKEGTVVHDAVRGVVRQESAESSHAFDTLSGSWLTHLNWEQGVESTSAAGKLHTVWDVSKSPVTRVVASKSDDVLPSDSRYRRDLVELKKGDIDSAQAAKIELEQLQRADRRLRSQNRGSYSLFSS